jgi:hypothetical protein
MILVASYVVDSVVVESTLQCSDMTYAEVP